MRKPIKGKEDLETWCINNHKEYLLAEWDYALNTVQPDEMFPKSEKEVMWKCKSGLHSYPAQICFRTRSHTGCCYCAGKRVLVGYNDLLSQYPTIGEEWASSKNETSPSDVVKMSHKKVWWTCKVCGNDYQARIADRTLKESGCPYCAGRFPLRGINDLATWCENNDREILLLDWAYDLNGNKRPEEYTYASNQSVYWRCHKCKKVWKASIYERSVRAFECTDCRVSGTSFPEQFLFLSLDELIGNAKNRVTVGGYEFDIFFENYKIAIEYNGTYYHSKKEQVIRDRKKCEFCKKEGIHLLQIVDSDQDDVLQEGDGAIIWNYSRDYEDLVELVKHVIEWMSRVIPDSIEMSHVVIPQDIYQNAKKRTYGISPEKSLWCRYPDIASEWDYSKNGEIKPENVSAGSHDSYYWICSKCNTKWLAKISSRTVKGTGCPNCGKEKQIDSWVEGRRKKCDFYRWCLDHDRFDLLESWNYKLNNGKGPKDYSYGSNESVYWLCPKCGHEWNARIANRRQQKLGEGCPQCARDQRRESTRKTRVIPGKNDLVSWCKTNGREDLLLEWAYELNDCKPEDRSYGSREIVAWECSKCRKVFRAAIKRRTIGNAKCNCKLLTPPNLIDYIQGLIAGFASMFMISFRVDEKADT